MMVIRRLMRDQSGAPAAEFVLAIPMILPLIFIAMEAGNFFWSQQKLVQAVRDGARYASRLPVDEICDTTDNSWKERTRNLTRTGTLDASKGAKLPGWTDGQVTVNAPESCEAFVDTGIYSQLGKAGPVVEVAAPAVRYRSILGQLGVINDTYFLGAEAYAPVTGI